MQRSFVIVGATVWIHCVMREASGVVPVVLAGVEDQSHDVTTSSWDVTVRVSGIPRKRGALGMFLKLKPCRFAAICLWLCSRVSLSLIVVTTLLSLLLRTSGRSNAHIAAIEEPSAWNSKVRWSDALVKLNLSILPSSSAHRCHRLVAGGFEARTSILLRSISLKVVPELDLILRAARAAARPL